VRLFLRHELGPLVLSLQAPDVTHGIDRGTFGLDVTPARTLEGLLTAMSKLGIDVARVRAAAGLIDALDPESTVPQPNIEAVFAAAAEQRPEPELPTLLGLAAPFGCFGVVDYLAGSSETIDGALRALAAHFAGITRHVRLILEEHPDGLALEVSAGEGAAAFFGEESTIAINTGRFSRLAGPHFHWEWVTLRRPSPGASRHRELLGCPVQFGATASVIFLSHEVAALPLSSADPNLRSALGEVVKRLDLAPAEASGLEVAIRSRLRDLMPRGQITAAAVARTMGLSERTLHRRVATIGKTFQEVLDDFRARESERLLRAKRPLVEIAMALGYADQTAWSRAFRRWKGVSPTAWRPS
jgi:AraC-like DNA-binding protein